MKLKNINRILFITLTNIGDAVLTLPVLTALKDAFPEATIDVVVGPRPKEIFEKDPKMSNIYVYDKHSNLGQKIGFINILRKNKYDLAIDMRNSLIPILTGARYRTPVVFKKKMSGKHKKKHHLSKLDLFNIEYRKKPNLYIADEDRIKIKEILKNYGFKDEDILIGISPSCRNRWKQWRAEGFSKVIESFLTKPDHKIALIGDKSQIMIAERIKKDIKHPGLIDLTGKINLNELFALVEKMKVLLTCDSAAMHVACDLGVKTVAIFGPTDPEEYGPTGESDIIIKKDLKCSPCKKSVCSLNHECMTEVSSKEVIEAVEKELSLQ